MLTSIGCTMERQDIYQFCGWCSLNLYDQGSPFNTLSLSQLYVIHSYHFVEANHFFKNMCCGLFFIPHSCSSDLYINPCFWQICPVLSCQYRAYLIQQNPFQGDHSPALDLFSIMFSSSRALIIFNFIFFSNFSNINFLVSLQSDFRDFNF